MAAREKKAIDLREACIQEALAIIELSGVEELSLREVARRIGVSHQAPYKHFPSRDHILAEIISRSYTAFAKYLEARPQTGDPDTDLGAMGEAYIEYANKHPLQYRLMFNTPLPDPDQHPEMMRHARYAFSLLQSAIAKLHASTEGPGPHRRTDFDALFIWFTLHGYCSLMPSQVMKTLKLSSGAIGQLRDHIFLRFGCVLDAKIE
jgi:AcrR family transcriptional regulator